MSGKVATSPGASSGIGAVVAPEIASKAALESAMKLMDEKVRKFMMQRTDFQNG